MQGVVLRMHQQFAAGPHLPDRFSFYKGMGSGLGSGMVQAVAQHFNFQLAPVPKPVPKKRGQVRLNEAKRRRFHLADHIQQ